MIAFMFKQGLGLLHRLSCASKSGCPALIISLLSHEHVS